MMVRSLLLRSAPLGALVAVVSLGAPSPAVSMGTTPTIPVAADEADSLYTIAGDLYAQARYEDAIPLFERVVELEPRHGNAHALLGGAYFHLGDYPNAIRAFERALELDEGIKLAYVGLVASNYLTERIEAAQGWLQRLVPILSIDERDRFLARLTAQFPLLAIPGS